MIINEFVFNLRYVNKALRNINIGHGTVARMQSSITRFLKPKMDSQANSTPEKPDSSGKRRAEDDVLGTPPKLQALSSSKETPTKVNPLASPRVDSASIVRQKISQGAHALHENIGISWFRALQNEFDKPYFRKLSEFVKQQRQSNTVYPPEDMVFSWTHYTDISDTRVVILGQDPYHGPGQAHGLCFSVQKGIRTPPSLINIFKELEKDIEDFKTPSHGDLTNWAKQGVLLLNTCLTVNRGAANSHQLKGWEDFTDSVINWLSKNVKHKLVFMLWGRPAQRKVPMINKRHKILTAAHPSPLSAHNGFFDCRHFSQANTFLKSQGLREINWKNL